ncbi:hypothetical protein [Ferrimonas gelatinilytica]|uniref:Uncharacterized protein n=1 Tax=Ferrimonas gelatinilytica TaxID=1255257 RepID=A0ABP9S114_9GAMM
MNTDGFTLPQAVRKLFGVKLSAHTVFRNRVNSLDRSLGLTTSYLPVGSAAGRAKHYISSDNLTKLHNAILLHGFFGDVRKVAAIMKEASARQENAQLLQQLVVGRSVVAGILMDQHALGRFFELLYSDRDLAVERLANPFITLPQLQHDGPSSLIEAARTELSLMDPSDQILVHYLEDTPDSLQSAAALAASYEPKSRLMAQLKERILMDFEEAERFDTFLDEIR